jgi:hypothetical protein
MAASVKTLESYGFLACRPKRANTCRVPVVRAAVVLAALFVSSSAIAAPPPSEPRLGWPADGRLDGVYAHIGMIGQPWFPHFLDRIAAAGMNAVVVDGKDYSGWITYPSTIPLAGETHAASHAVLGSLPRLVHAAHERGVRVVLRLASAA